MRLNKLPVIIAIIASFLLGMAFSPRVVTVAQDAISALTSGEQNFANIYNTVSPSVVSIAVDRRVGAEFVQYSSGSGFVVDANGYIATNFHVVDGADRVVVNFFDGTIVEGEVVGSDPDADVAIIEVDVPRDRLTPVTFGDSDDLVVGQTALAIGSPFGQRWTLTSGIISALDRSIEGLQNYNTGAVIQTDTAINPGNSGGPLLNNRGEVIGITTQILSEVRANSGVGFAVPSNLVRRVVSELIEFGDVQYSYLGIRGTDIALEDIERLNLPNNVRGVILRRVNPGEPAALSGLEFEDVIIAIDDNPIIGFGSLLGYLSINTVPDDTVKMTVLRNGDLIDVDVVLGAR